MSIVEQVDEKLKELASRMQDVIERIESARSLQESWDGGSAALAQVAKQGSNAATAALDAVRLIGPAVEALKGAETALSAADATQLREAITQVEARVQASESVLRSFLEERLTEAEERRTLAEAKQRRMLLVGAILLSVLIGLQFIR